MKHLKFAAFFVGLALAVGGAVSVINAQDVRVAPRSRGDVFVLDGRGAQLGVRVSDVDVKERAGGARIDAVSEDSPAEKAGLQRGDVVVEYDGERVRSARQFTRLVQETPDGKTVTVAVLRNGQKQTVEATPEAGRNPWDFGREPGVGTRDPEFFLRQFPHFDFEFDDRVPRRFQFRIPDPGSGFPASRGRLGVSIQSLTPELEQYFGATNGGVLVSSVAQDSAAAKAGMKAGDVITTVNGNRVSDSGDLRRELGNATGEVTIVVLRDKKELTLKATLTTAGQI